MPPYPQNIRIERLCVLAQSGDESAERELFSLLTVSFGILAGHLIRDHAEAEDVVQEALTVVAQKYRGTAFDTSFAGWAHNVLRNTVMRYAQTKATRTRLRPDADRAMHPEQDCDPDAELVREVTRCLEKVARTNRKFARALNLRYQGFTAAEISDRLEIRADHLYVLLGRARSMLAACLGIVER